MIQPAACGGEGYLTNERWMNVDAVNLASAMYNFFVLREWLESRLRPVIIIVDSEIIVSDHDDYRRDLGWISEPQIRLR